MLLATVENFLPDESSEVAEEALAGLCEAAADAGGCRSGGGGGGNHSCQRRAEGGFRRVCSAASGYIRGGGSYW